MKRRPGGPPLEWVKWKHATMKKYKQNIRKRKAEINTLHIRMIMLTHRIKSSHDLVERLSKAIINDYEEAIKAAQVEI